MRSAFPTRVAGAAILAGIGLVLAAGASGSRRLQLAVSEGGPACPFLAVTSLPCPFCGLTRATMALGSGDVGSALSFHPLSPVILAVTAWGAWRLARGRLPGLSGRRFAIAAAACVAVVWTVKLFTHPG